MTLRDTPQTLKGRGAGYNPGNRFATSHSETVADDWAIEAEPLPPLATQVRAIPVKQILSHNDSPDVPFAQSLNPYQGCEHGCIYCYARPSHAYHDLSPGLDFETRLMAKPDAAQRLRETFAKRAYVPKTIALGSNTDCYQPIEREWKITRSILELCLETRHPIAFVTKNALVLRDLDLLRELAQHNLVHVFITITTLDHDLARLLEPRASSPASRLKTLARLAGAGIPVGTMVAPVIPWINDDNMENVLAAAAQAGAQRAHYTVLRLAHELRELFDDWLLRHFPDRRERVWSTIMALRGGQRNDPEFGTRMTGEGIWAELINRRFRIACQRIGLNRTDWHDLSSEHFRKPIPPRKDGQLDLFG